MKNTTPSCAGLFRKGGVTDTRKVQITGKSTFIVTLPKKWVTSSRLTAGTQVGFSYQEDGSVLLVPPDVGEEHLVRKIRADRNIEDLERDITALYVLGNCHIIEVHGTEITAGTRDMIKNLCKRLIGFEIVESSGNRILIQNLLNTEDFTIEKAAKRMFSLVFLMFDDLARVLEENDTLLCRELASRSIEIDRTYFLVSRMYLGKMNVKNVSVKDDLNLTQAFYYRLATEDIDRISDHITKIVSHFENGNITPEFSSQMAELCQTLRDMFRDAFESFKLADSELANNIITRGMELESVIGAFREGADMVAISRKELMLDSCCNIRDHISKIARLSIELSHL
jgi:phosphate uptake regulator